MYVRDKRTKMRSREPALSEAEGDLGFDAIGTAAKANQCPRLPSPFPLSPKRAIRLTISLMAKKTGMSDSSLWIFTVVLLLLAAWLYFRR